MATTKLPTGETMPTSPSDELRTLIVQTRQEAEECGQTGDLSMALKLSDAADTAEWISNGGKLP